MKYKESDLNISFDPSWRSRRFDTSRYFKALSGLGLKGVDFIAIDDEHRLYLIEVKNYKKRLRSPVAPDISDLMGDVPLLQYHFVDKIDDSRQLLEVIYKYLHRKWWYRSLFRMRNLLTTSVVQSLEWVFWYDAFKIANTAHTDVYCILLLETEDYYPALSKKQLTEHVENLLYHSSFALRRNTGSVEVLDLDQWEQKYC